MHVYLIGLPGSGKTTVSQLVADRLGRPRISLDDRIVARAGCSIADLFARWGEPEFRRRESLELAAAAAETPAVIDLGGGALLDAENRRRIAATGYAIWLTAPLDELWDRLCADPRSAETRPALAAGRAPLEQMQQQRHATYAACADCIVETAGRSPLQIAEQIAQWIRTADTLE